MLTRAAALLAALTVTVAGVASLPDAAAIDSPPVDGAPGIGDPYFPLDGNGGIDVLVYHVHDTYRFSDRRLSGWTSLRLRTTETLSSFDLDFLLPVRSVRLSTGPATFNRPSRHELRIRPADPLPAGSVVRVRVEYAGYPGHLRWQGEHNWSANRDEALALGEPHMAPWWFPADDHPLDKARMDLHLTVPRGRQVVSNGRLVHVAHTQHHATYHWRASRMATYLAFFAAGRFDVRRGSAHGLPYYLAVSRELPGGERRSAMRGLEQTPTVVHWLRRHLGPYPFRQSGGVVTSLNPGFALETQTRPTYPEGVSPLLMVHELAHQWFGDSVSLRRWHDIWLNEGFATYLERLWDEEHGGLSTYTWLRGSVRNIRGDSPFWQLPIDDPGVPDLFDWAVYQRGAMTLAALRHRIGRASFDQVLRSWAAAHRHGHGTSAQFEALAAQISGQDLDSFFDAWLREPQRPADIAANGLGGSAQER